VSAAADDVTSLGASAPASAGAIAFTTTHWGVVLEAQGESPAAQEALENLCRTYWRPIYSFVRREGVGPEEAKDLTQGFFALILERIRRRADCVLFFWLRSSISWRTSAGMRGRSNVAAAEC
jgi:hypothetical protein